MIRLTSRMKGRTASGAAVNLKAGDELTATQMKSLGIDGDLLIEAGCAQTVAKKAAPKRAKAKK